MQHPLGELWNASADFVFTNSQGKVVFVPKDDYDSFQDGHEVALPREYEGKAVFALTAFDPPGEIMSRAQNRANNDAMGACLIELSEPTPNALLASFGVDFISGWREDGFVVSFAEEDRLHARVAIVDIARNFRQGAIFEYNTCSKTNRLHRRTVPVCMSLKEIDQAAIPMEQLSSVPHLEGDLLNRPWAGPDELLFPEALSRAAA